MGPVSQTCAIVGLDRAFIRTGDRATVAFRFVQRPEWVRVGDRILFREGRTKGLGIVKALGWDRSKGLGEGGTTVTTRINGEVGEMAAGEAAVRGGADGAEKSGEGDANGHANGQAKVGAKVKVDEKG